MLTSMRLGYEPLRDVEWAWAFFRDPHVRRFLLDDEVVPREWVEAEIARSEASFARHGVGLWVLRPRDEPRTPIGIAGFRWYDESASHQLLYALEERHCGRGYATEAAHRLAHLAMVRKGFERVIAATDAPNRASATVLQRLGFEELRQEGPLVYRAVDRAGLMTSRTERLVLREWRDEDLPAFAALNADPEVMEHFPATSDRAASDATAARIRAHFDEHAFGLWAVEVVGGAPFIGFTGLQVTPFRHEWIEIGWRLAREHWGHGYATEAARCALRFAFERLGLEEVVSMTVPANARSRNVMEKLGLVRNPADDFDHPRMAVGHPLRRHVLYRIQRQDSMRSRR